MRKVILVNGIITFVGVILDTYGIFDLTFFPALLGLVCGLIDVVTFFWMRDEIREMYRRWREIRREKKKIH